MSENKLSCKNIGKAFGKKVVLENVDLELEKGKIYGLIGRNGAGKTTLLSIMSGQNPASGGEVTLNGQPVWENQEVLDQICFSRELNPVNQNGGNTMKVKEYLRAASIYMPHWDQEMADKLVKEFEIDVKCRINKLSKGMMSAVTIIVALASKAEFTLLDEPVAGLDVVMREVFYRLLLEEFAESGRTFVISTHIIEEAAGIFEEVIMMNKGKIILKENTQELLDRAVHISGKSEAVDKAIAGKKLYHHETIGRSKGAMLLLNAGETFPANPELSVQPMSLQQIFVGMCGKEVE